MNPNSAETRRQMRAATEANREAVPRFARALRAAFDPDSTADRLDRATLTGVPASRRGFLRMGGLTVAASAVLIACGTGDDSAGVARTGSVPEPGEPDPVGPEPGPEMDNSLLLTASSIEALAIATYDDLLDKDLLENGDAVDMANLFRDQHSEHLDQLVATTEDLGVSAYRDPNPYLWETIVEPELTAIDGLEEGNEQRRAVLDLTYRVEDLAAQNYVRSAGLLTTPELREGAMAIGGVEASHVSMVLATIGEPAVPFAFGRTSDAPSTDNEMITA